MCFNLNAFIVETGRSRICKLLKKVEVRMEFPPNADRLWRLARALDVFSEYLHGQELTAGDWCSPQIFELPVTGKNFHYFTTDKSFSQYLLSIMPTLFHSVILHSIVAERYVCVIMQTCKSELPKIHHLRDNQSIFYNTPRYNTRSDTVNSQPLISNNASSQR